MAGSLKTNIALTSAGSWLKVMGQGVRSLTANDEYTASIQLQNRGSSKATALVALVHGNAAPASDDVAGFMRPIEIDKDRRKMQEALLNDKEKSQMKNPGGGILE